MFAKFAIAAATLLAISVGSTANAQTAYGISVPNKTAVSIPKPPVSTPVVVMPSQGQVSVPSAPAPKPPTLPGKLPGTK
jgi:hypothetical protein